MRLTWALTVDWEIFSTAASHGCIRLDNAAVSWLARRAIEGTPVVVRG